MKIRLSVIACMLPAMMSAQMLTRENETVDTLCQSTLTAVYQYTIRTTDADGLPVTDSIRLALQVGSGVWKTWTYERYLYQCGRDDEIGSDHYWFQQSEALMHVATTLVGHPEGHTVSVESVPPQQYEVTEETETPAWNLGEGSDSVCGYICRKAYTDFRGRRWNVLYADDIPTAAGPWKLHGLPGLITLATDADGIHTFRLIGIYQEAVPITCQHAFVTAQFSVTDRRIVNTHHPYEVTSREQMQKHMMKVFDNRQYLTDPLFYITGPKTIFTTYGSDRDYRFVGGLFVPDKAHKYQPLELK